MCDSHTFFLWAIHNFAKKCNKKFFFQIHWCVKCWCKSFFSFKAIHYSISFNFDFSSKVIYLVLKVICNKWTHVLYIIHYRIEKKKKIICESWKLIKSRLISTFPSFNEKQIKFNMNKHLVLKKKLIRFALSFIRRKNSFLSTMVRKFRFSKVSSPLCSIPRRRLAKRIWLRRLWNTENVNWKLP